MKNILVLINDPKNADHIAHFALHIATKTKAKLTLAHLTNGNSDPKTAIDVALIERKYDDLLRLTNHLKKVLPFGTQQTENPMINSVVADTDLAKFSARMVADEGVNLIVMGPQKKSNVRHFVFGTAVDAVLDHVNCPLLIVPDHIKFNGFQHITFAADFSSNYQNALRYTANLAAFFDGKITVNNVSITSFPEKIAELDISKTVNEKLEAGSATIAYHTLKGKNVKSTLQDMLDENEVDLLCLVHRQYDLVSGLFIKA